MVNFVWLMDKLEICMYVHLKLDDMSSNGALCYLSICLLLDARIYCNIYLVYLPIFVCLVCSGMYVWHAEFMT